MHARRLVVLACACVCACVRACILLVRVRLWLGQSLQVFLLVKERQLLQMMPKPANT